MYVIWCGLYSSGINYVSLILNLSLVSVEYGEPFIPALFPQFLQLIGQTHTLLHLRCGCECGVWCVGKVLQLA